MELDVSRASSFSDSVSQTGSTRLQVSVLQGCVHLETGNNDRNDDNVAWPLSKEVKRRAKDRSRRPEGTADLVANGGLIFGSLATGPIRLRGSLFAAPHRGTVSDGNEEDEAERRDGIP